MVRKTREFVKKYYVFYYKNWCNKCGTFILNYNHFCSSNNNCTSSSWSYQFLEDTVELFKITSSIAYLILINALLNSKPQPLDKRKSANTFPSISIKFTLKTSDIFRRSTVNIVSCKINIVYSISMIFFIEFIASQLIVCLLTTPNSLTR